MHRNLLLNDLKQLVELCENYLKQFDEKYSLFVLQIAKKCNLKELYNHIYWYVINHLNECINATTFTEIEPTLLIEILSK